MKKPFPVPVKPFERECGECTKCCDGWLAGNIKGHQMYPGQPCFFVTKNGCSDYENRPQEPCKKFECLWKSQPDIFPAWMRPDLVGSILTSQKIQDIEFVYLVECGTKPDSSMLSWLFQKMVDGTIKSINYMGAPEFVVAMNNQGK
jgi:hypothetical protein